MSGKIDLDALKKYVAEEGLGQAIADVLYPPLLEEEPPGSGYWVGREIDNGTVDRLHADVMAVIRRHVAPAPAAPELAGLRDCSGVYEERDRLVCALSKVFPAHLVDATDAEDGWSTVVIIDLPTGQASWHISDIELLWFDHLERRPNDWDGHSSAAKYQRLHSLLPAPRVEGVLIPRELAERAVDAFRDSTAWDRHVGFGDKRTRAALADADQLRALLGREGNDA